MGSPSEASGEAASQDEIPMLGRLDDSVHHTHLIERTKLVFEILGHYKVLVCNPNLTFGELLKGQLKIIASKVSGRSLVGIAHSCDEGRALIDQVSTRLIVITTVALIDGPVNDWLTELRQRHTPTFVIVIMDAAHRSTVKAVLNAGAHAVLLQANIGRGVLLEALRSIEKGKQYLDHDCRQALENPGKDSDELSVRELEILELVAQGISNKQIAQSLVIAEVTARDHVQSILRKLRVENRTAAVLAGLRHGYLH